MLRDVLRRVDPEIALEQVQGTSELVATILSPARLVATIVGLLGTAGLVLLALGVFGATAAALRAATTEIAIRQALGATAIQAARAPLMMFARALMLGLGVGLPMAPLALSAARALGIDGSATIMTMAAAALAVCGAALVATGPALWRAARQSPADLLRQA
jgi:ABC-type antimicrobial peptide transport system permease subunit